MKRSLTGILIALSVCTLKSTADEALIATTSSGEDVVTVEEEGDVEAVPFELTSEDAEPIACDPETPEVCAAHTHLADEDGAGDVEVTDAEVADGEGVSIDPNIILYSTAGGEVQPTRGHEPNQRGETGVKALTAPEVQVDGGSMKVLELEKGSARAKGFSIRDRAKGQAPSAVRKDGKVFLRQ